MRRWAAAGLLALGLASCGDGPEALPDADVGADAGDGGVATPAAPDIPWLEGGVPPIAIAPCPMGWRTITDTDEATTCDPYPEGGARECPFGEAHFPGEPDCRPIGQPCPAGDYAAGLPASGSIVYVNASAALGGDGSIGAPFSSIGEVPFLSLGAGTTVALAKGEYDGTFALRSGVRLVGACVAETILHGGGPAAGVVAAMGRGEPAVLENIAIVDAPQMGLRVEGGSALSLDGVLVAEATGAGIVVQTSGRVDAASLVVTDTRALAGRVGRGLDVESAGQLDAAGLIVSGNRHAGVLAIGEGLVVHLSDVVIRDTVSQDLDGGGGFGIRGEDGPVIEASRVLIEGNHDHGASVLGATTTMSLTDAIVRDTAPRTAGSRFGHGVGVYDGARFEATRLLATRNTDSGVTVAGEGSLASLTDAVVRESVPGVYASAGGRGVTAATGGGFEATRLVVTNNHDVGVFATGAGTSLLLTDVLVRETTPRDDAFPMGRGIEVEEGASLTATRLVATGNHDIGVLANGADSTADLSSVVVRDMSAPLSGDDVITGVTAQTGARVSATGLLVERIDGVGVAALDASLEITDGVVQDVTSHGVEIQQSATCSATRLLVARAQEVGLLVLDSEASATLVDTTIRDTAPDTSSLAFGYALLVEWNATVSAERLAIEHASELGLVAIGDAMIDARDVTIADVGRSACDCPDRGYGYGVAALGAAVRLTRFSVVDAATCGLFLADEPPFTISFDTESGVVEGADIGACVQVDGYDLDRLSQDVSYRDNGTNLDSTSLPTPDPIGEL